MGESAQEIIAEIEKLKPEIFHGEEMRCPVCLGLEFYWQRHQYGAETEGTSCLACHGTGWRPPVTDDVLHRLWQCGAVMPGVRQAAIEGSNWVAHCERSDIRDELGKTPLEAALRCLLAVLKEEK